MSHRKRTNILWKLYDSKNTVCNVLLYILVMLRSLDDVNAESLLSPENMFAMLIPFTSRPSPLLIIFSITGEWLNFPETIIWFVFCFSTHLYATMFSLFPCNIPAWLAPVCEDRSVSHSFRVCVFPSIQPLSVGMTFLSRAFFRVLIDRPSISSIRTPGYCFSSLFFLLRAYLKMVLM